MHPSAIASRRHSRPSVRHIIKYFIIITDFHQFCNSILFKISDRIAGSLKTTGKSPKFEGLLLEIGVHNGRKFVGAPKEVALEKGEQKGLYVYKKDHKISDYLQHNMVSIVVLVHARYASVK